ncbi:hypothetical protein [Phytohabitans suffuscus]|uniref:hypothetical protein n=1 Tax=Phytohabitans suffuscus TaxID=624315 RepID=UPI0015677BB5|nr:hypothetical protein [Phytohabitans suffuscus]
MPNGTTGGRGRRRGPPRPVARARSEASYAPGVVQLVDKLWVLAVRDPATPFTSADPACSPRG